MASLNENLMYYGKLLFRNSFDTVKGFYTIRVFEYEGNFYLHKMKNGQVVEIKNINKEARKEKKDA